MSSPTIDWQAQVPRSAFWLGAAGALPFILLALVSIIPDSEISQTSLTALTAYGAVILSFLGGIHWGLAIAAPEEDEANNQLLKRLGWSVVPSLVAWLALLLPILPGLIVLAIAFALWLVFDMRTTMNASAPIWYPRLRAPLTAVVVCCLLLGAFVAS